MTQDQINTIAQRASWYFDVQTNHIDFKSDSSVHAGDGVDDLDRLIELYPIYPRIRVSVEIGSTGATDHRPCDLEDIQAIRAAYVGYHGEVDRVPASVRASSAIGT